MRNSFRITAISVTAALALMVAAAPAAKQFQAKLNKDRQAAHVVERLTFGARPGDVERVRKMGVDKFIEEQLHPEKLSENPELASKLEPLKTTRMTVAELFEAYPLRAQVPRAATQTQGQQQQPRQPNGNRVVYLDLSEAKLQRAVYSTHQLEELMVDFWYNHFNVFFDKGAARRLVPSYERDAIRPHVLGKFRDLLAATAQHPAMLFYLDNWQSSSIRGLNENYGRELLELHTLGVDGGYTQQDVTEVARCFTGWTLVAPRVNASFFFAQRQHDRGEKAVLGTKIPAGGGRSDGEKVLDLLARHPSTARFISRKLAVRFVADDPPAALVERMARTFEDTGGDIREVLRTMFHSREFLSEGAWRSKVKTPFEMVVSAARATGADVRSARAMVQQLTQMGQPLYRKQEPTGYAAANAEWVNSSALLARMNFALALSRNRMPGIRVAEDAVGPEIAKLGSPDFQRR